jgi:hypothetical protein
MLTSSVKSKDGSPVVEHENYFALERSVAGLPGVPYIP